MPDQDEILTISEVAELLKIAEKTVYGLAQRGEIPAFKVGGQWRFSRAALDSWIKASTRAAGDTGNAGGDNGNDARASGTGTSRKGGKSRR
jgi:excisionase family DNA binding protein